MSEISNIERVAVLLKPKGMEHEHEIVTELNKVCIDHDLSIIWERHLLFSYREAFEFCAGNKGKWYRRPGAKLISGVILHGFEVQGPNAIEILRKWVGPTDPVKAKVEQPDCPRALFGEGDMAEMAKVREGIDNALHISTSGEDARREIDLMKHAYFV